MTRRLLVCVVCLGLSGYVLVPATAKTDGVSVERSTQGPMMGLRHTLPTSANYLEFSKVGDTVRGTIGAIGNFEMNMGFNLNYADSIHRPYDPTVPMVWTAMSGSGMYVQYAPANAPVDANGDAWHGSGDRTPFYYDPALGRSTQTGGAGFGGEVNLTGTSGKLGIGVTSPKGLVQLWDPGSYANPQTYTASGAQNGNGLLFNSYAVSVGNGSIRYGDIASVGNAADPLGGSELRFLVNPSTSLTAVEALHLNRDASVTVPTLAGSGSTHVCADAAGKLFRCP